MTTLAAPGQTLAELYAKVKRIPREGSLSEAIKVHSQACGLVAYVFDVHPDVVARAVQHEMKR